MADGKNSRSVRKIILAGLAAAALLASIGASFAQLPPPVPGLPDAERRTAYSLTASNCSCSVGFALFGDSTDFGNWLEVFINGTQVTYNDPVFGWTITSPTGPLATIARPITDGVLTFNNVQTGTIQIVGARRPRRVSQFNENTGVPARNLNQALTDVVAMLREVWDKINDVTGRVVRAPPGETMTTLPPASQRASMSACFDSGGNLVPCASVGSSTFSAGNGITFTGTNPTTITDNAQGAGPIVVTPGHPTTIGCPTCSTYNPPSTNFAYISTRAVAAAANLSSYSIIQTGGYSVAGDGGNATFKNVGTATLLDSYLATGFVNIAGTGCPNGANQIFGTAGGHGAGAIFTVTISGGSITAASFNSTPGNGYAVGDQLTFPGLTCTGNTPNWQVSAVTTPAGSFTDTAGNNWQIQVQNNAINIRQFGAKVNWTPAAGDAGSTSDTAAIQNALYFAYYANGTLNSVGAGGVVGNRVIVPAGAALTCNLIVPYGVWLDGAGKYSSSLKECDGMAATLHFVTLCDPINHLACFGTRLTNIGLFPGSSSANSNIAMIFSNSLQQDVAIDHVNIQSGVRACINFDTGWGGAALIGIYSIECGPNNASSNPGIILGYSAAVQIIRDSVVETSSWTGYGIVANSGGVNIISGIHTEGITSPIYFNNTGSGGTINHVSDITGGAGCTSLVTRQNGSNVGLIKAGGLVPNGCTYTVNNAGTFITGDLVLDAAY